MARGDPRWRAAMEGGLCHLHHLNIFDAVEEHFAFALISLMQLMNTLPLQDLRMARDSNANWYSVLSKPATVVLEYLSLPAQHLKCRNLRLFENSSNVLQIFITNAQEWIQWNIVNVFQPKCENMCHRNVNKFESICSFFLVLKLTMMPQITRDFHKNIWIDWGLILI